MSNPDKGAISQDSIDERLAAFAQQGLPIVLTNASLFTQKAALFKRCTFALGYDTAVRIVMKKYYGDSDARMAAEFARLEGAGCSFAVAGRVDSGSGRFMTLRNVEVLDAIQDMNLFVEVPEDDFREDVSSTELRQQGKLLQ